MKAIATEEVKKINGRVIHFIQLGKLVQVNSTVSYGNMSFKYGTTEEVKQNREDFFFDLQLLMKEKTRKKVLEPILMNPVMGKDIRVVEQEMAGTGWKCLSPLKCDGLLLLRYPKVIIPVGLLAADCAPVSIYIPTVHSILVIHVSWKNIGIVEEALQIAYGIHLAGESNSSIFSLAIIVGPSGRYLFYEKNENKKIVIDIHRMIEKEIKRVEAKYSFKIEAYFSNYLTTSGDIFFSNHILNHLNQPPARFMSLTFIV